MFKYVRVTKSHCLQDGNPLNGNYFDELSFKATVGRFPTGLTVVTGVEDGEPHGLTLQSFMSLSLNPTLIALAVAKTSTTWPKIEPSSSFAVNILADSHGELLARRFASGDASRFTSVAFGTTRSGNPVLDGAAAWLDCTIVTTFEAGDHLLVVGEVIELMEAADVPVEHPIVYYRSQFRSLAPHA